MRKLIRVAIRRGLMTTQDFLDPDFKQKPIILISEDEKLKVMSNPIYYPILASLREGHKTVKEIEEDYLKFLKKDAKKAGKIKEEEV